MRISAYARATNPKYANFNPFNWQGLAGQLGTKASKALSTPVGAAKLGAGIGAGVGAINYLGSDDKSIGNLAGQVGGGAALGGAAGYGGSKLKNAWQARKTGNQALLPATTNASATNVTQTPINNQPFTPNAPKPQAQLPAAQPVQRPQPTQNGVITTPAPANQQTIDTTAITVPNASGQTQSGASRPTNLNNPNPVGATTERISPKSQKIKPDELKPNEPEGSVRRRGRQRTMDASRKTSPFANFKVRRYNGFIY
jgi:hypothetical protein